MNLLMRRLRLKTSNTNYNPYKLTIGSAMRLERISRAIVCFIVTTLAGGSSLSASPIIPANDGVGTVVSQSGMRFDITGGTQAGANLFHSLQKFGLSEGQIANFLSRPDILNVLARVVGGETSVINGLIQLTGGNSNLFIMNPAGVVFGAGASVNVPASFSVTTANAIKVGSGYFSINTTPSELQQLTGTPNGFAFSNLNTHLDGTTATGNSVIINQGNLTVPEGQSIVLAGGVVINTGKIETPHGNILISATPDGKFVNISAEGSVLSYNLPIADNQDLRATNLRPFQGSDLANLVTNGTAVVGGTLSTASSTPNPASTIFLVGEQVQLQNALLNNQGTDGLIRMQVSPSTPVTGFVFLDRVRNYEQIANALLGGNQLILLNRNDSGTAKVSQVLANQTNIQALHFVGDGNKGQIWLGRDFITNDTLSQYSNELSKWRTALASSADILFYNCNLAQTADGQLLLTTIKNLTGANISASTDLTGNARYGGNWVLEYGKANTPLPFDPQKITTADVRLLTYAVTNTNDTALSGVPGELRSELDNANNFTPGALDTVRFTVSGTINLAFGELFITDDTIFDVDPGVNITIDGNGASRVFNLGSGQKATFDGTGGSITITGGSDTDGGGIFADTGSTLVLQNNVTITGNFALNDGGGIFASNNSNVSITNATIYNNDALSGGGIFIDSNSVATITDSKITENLATVGGAGIANAGNLTVTTTTIDSNGDPLFPPNDGGGLLNQGTANIIASTLSRNNANNGGAIDNQGTLTITNSTIGNNTAVLSGGGIRNFIGATLTANNITISGNQNLDPPGPPTDSAGAIFNDSGATVNIGNSIIAGNKDDQGAATNEVRNHPAATFNSTAPNLVGENGNAGGFPVTAQDIVVPGVVLGVELGPLQVNPGGNTETFELLPTSIAYTVPSINGTPNDQYGAVPITFRNLGALQVNPPFPSSGATLPSVQREPEQRVAEPSQPFLCTTESYLSGTEATSKLPKCVQNILFTPSKKLNDLLRN